VLIAEVEKRGKEEGMDGTEGMDWDFCVIMTKSCGRRKKMKEDEKSLIEEKAWN